MFFDIDKQQLIYVKGERKVGKSRVVKAIEIEFTLLGRKKRLVISTLIDFVINSDCKSIVYIVLRVNNKVKKNYQVKNNMQQLYYSCLLIDKVNMINLPLLASIDRKF